MIRLFERPIPTHVLPRTRVTFGSLLLHVGFVVGFLLPLQEEVRRALLDREVIYLVPLTQAGGPERDRGTVPFASQATDPGVVRQDAAPEATSTAPATAGIDLELSDVNLKPAVSTQVLRETAVSELEVDSTVIRDPTSTAPAYPPLLLRQAVTGSVTARYVVDTLGAVDTLSIQVLAATRFEFEDAVRQALPGMRFRPAIQRGRRVRQWVEQTFHFRITRRDTVPTSEPPPSLGAVPA